MFWGFAREWEYAYLVRFDGPGQLRSKEKVFLICRVIDINQHPALGIRQIHTVVGVRPAALLWAAGASILISRLAAYLQGVLVPRAKLNYIRCIMAVNTVCQLAEFLYFLESLGKKYHISYHLQLQVQADWGRLFRPHHHCCPGRSRPACSGDQEPSEKPLLKVRQHPLLERLESIRRFRIESVKKKKKSYERSYGEVIFRGTVT